jgi:glycosyltransferase involved in cell wall biosynthesis
MERESAGRALLARPLGTEPSQGLRVCLHILSRTRSDVRAIRTATTLDQAGMAVSIVDVESAAARPRQEGAELDNVDVRHVMMPSWYVSTRFKPWFLVKQIRLSLHGAIEMLRMRADIYHACEVGSLPACYIAARLQGKPLIFDPYDLPLDYPWLARWHRLHALAAWVLRAMLPYCAGIIVTSSPEGRELQRRFGGPVPALVRNIPPYQVPAPSHRLHERLRLSPHTRIALYQGLLEEDRSLDTLVHAARFLDREIAIVLMGDGPRRPQLEALIAQEEVGDRVFLLPAVPNSELLAWTACAGLGLIVYPPDYSMNRRICLPNKLFEYLMAGLPVLTAPLEAIVEVVQTYDVGAVVPAVEPEAVGRAISALLADEAAVARMRRNALAACARELRWEVEQERLIALYRGALGVQHATLATE